MEISQIHGELKQNKVRNFYIFAGDEWEVQKIYINQISKIRNCETVRVDSITDITHSSNSFIPQEFIYVCRDDRELMSNEKVQAAKDRLIGNNTYILLLTNIDKRTRFYKKYKSDIIIFEPLKPAVLKKYIVRYISLNDYSMETIINAYGGDYGRILLELDKVKNYMEVHGIKSADKALETLINTGVVSIPPKDNVFDLLDTILNHNVKQTWKRWGEYKRYGGSSMALIALLYNNAKQVLQVQSYPGNNINKATGLNNWQVRNASKYCRVYTNRELIHIMDLCRQMEQGIKTGKIKESNSIDYILVNIL